MTADVPDWSRWVWMMTLKDELGPTAAAQLALAGQLGVYLRAQAQGQGWLMEAVGPDRDLKLFRAAVMTKWAEEFARGEEEPENGSPR